MMAPTISEQLDTRDTSNPDSIDYWEAVLVDELNNARQGLIEAGQCLLQAKCEHPGEFVAWLRRRPAGLSVRQSYYLMDIAETFGGLDLHMRANLPAEATTLRELARLPRDKVNGAIEAGEITPDMRTKDAKALVMRKTPVIVIDRSSGQIVGEYEDQDDARDAAMADEQQEDTPAEAFGSREAEALAEADAAVGTAVGDFRSAVFAMLGPTIDHLLRRYSDDDYVSIATSPARDKIVEALEQAQTNIASIIERLENAAAPLDA
jgi:hypothetical protein